MVAWILFWQAITLVKEPWFGLGTAFLRIARRAITSNALAFAIVSQSLPQVFNPATQPVPADCDCPSATGASPLSRSHASRISVFTITLVLGLMISWGVQDTLAQRTGQTLTNAAVAVSYTHLTLPTSDLV